MVAVRGSRCGIRSMSSGVDRTAGATDTFQAHKVRLGVRAPAVVRYLTGQLGGGEPSHPPVSSLRQVADAVELAVAEIR